MPDALIYIAISVAALAALIFIGTIIAINYNMRPVPARDLLSSDLSGTRFESCADTLRRDVESFRALPWEDVYITSYDGLKLHGRVLQGGPGADTVVLIHGYHSSAENDFAGIADWYAANGYTVVAADQRAHGLSEGRHITFGAAERRDAVAWAQYAEYALGSRRTWMHGVSMGGASVLYALGDGYPDSVQGVIADCPYDSVMQLFAMHVKRNVHLPPWFVLSVGSLAWALLEGAEFTRASCHECAAQSELPVLLFSAGEDSVVPEGSAERVKDACGGRARLVNMPHAFHALCWQAEPETYAAALGEFLGL